MTTDVPAVDVEFVPIDTWYFADGTPSSGDSSGQQEVGGLFPPRPATVVGAVRATLARANGWSGRGGWSQELREVLGDGYGPDDLGLLSFDGPYLLRQGEPLYPAPAHILGSPDEEGQWRARGLLHPGDRVTCDLGEVRLPAPPAWAEASWKPAGTGWIGRDDLDTVLRGGLPAAPVARAGNLWALESRVGIARCSTTRTVREGMLYNARHVRPHPGVSIGIRVHGLPPDWKRPANGALVPFGGEARMAGCHRWSGGLRHTAPYVADSEGGTFTAIALTPLDVGEEIYRGSAPMRELGGARIVSACLPKAEQIGGWQTVPRPGPAPLRSTLPAGSVLFCEGADPEQLRAAVTVAEGPVRVGEHQRWGFGAMALGRWPGHER